jgi:hypothetical protein
MGNSASRIDRFYGNYEKSFDRIEKDVVRLKVRVGRQDVDGVGAWGVRNRCGTLRQPP